MLYDKLENYSNSGIYPFHMPGHKRNAIFDSSLIPYKIDLTEIYDFDNLHNAEGCILDVQKKCESAYDVDNAFLLVNGATGGILSAIRAITNYGDKVLISRNCHKSVYNAIELCGLDAIYVLPETDNTFGVFSSVTPKQIEKFLTENSDIKLVVLTSPTYEGVVSDIKSISKICHKFNAKLFVDEAHGAHFPFSRYFPKEAVKCGADVAVVSLHKSLPSLTQTALVLINDKCLANKIEDSLSVFETSSPSYILMSSIEKCIDFINTNAIMFDEYTARLSRFSEKCKLLNNLSVMCFGNDNIQNHSYFDFDISKIIISTKNTNICGTKLAEILRNKYKIELEMAYTDYVIAISSVCDTEDGFNRLSTALIEIDHDCYKNNSNVSCYVENKIPEKVFKSCVKHKYIGKFVCLENAIGKVSLEYVWAYPPGIPLLVAGERITKNIVQQITNLNRNNIETYSTFKMMPNKIYVSDLD